MTKKTERTAEAAEGAAEVTTAAEPQEEKKTYCYIGPNLPDGALKRNTVIIGTKQEIKEKYQQEIEKYPQVERLIIEIEQLAESKAKIAQGGNYLTKSYEDVEAVIAGNERG